MSSVPSTGDLLLWCGVARVVLLVNEPNVRRKPVTWPGRRGIVSRRWLLSTSMSTGLVTSKKTDTVRSAVMKMMCRHCGTIPVVEGESRLIEIVTLSDVLLPLSRALDISSPRFESTWQWRYDDENNFLDLLDHGLCPNDRLSVGGATRCHSHRCDEEFFNDRRPKD